MMRLDLYDNSDFSRGASRLKESLWLLCKAIFFLAPLPFPSRLRVGLLRLFGAKLGRGVVIHSGVNITFPWRFEAGDHVWVGEGVTILSLARVVLGSQVCISQQAYLCTGSHNWRLETFDLQVGEIAVGAGTFVAARAFVGRSVTIGEDTVLSAGTVLFRSVPAGSFVMGNPAVVTAKATQRLDAFQPGVAV